MTITITIRNAIGENISHATVELYQGGKPVRTLVYDPGKRAYLGELSLQEEAQVRARCKGYWIDPVDFPGGVPRKSYVTMSAGRAKDVFFRYEGRRIFCQVWQGHVGAVVKVGLGLEEQDQLGQLEKEIGLTRVGRPQPPTASPLGRTESRIQYYALADGTQKCVEALERMRASGYFDLSGLVLSGGIVYQPVLSVQADADGVRWLEQAGYAERMMAGREGAFTIHLSGLEELRIFELIAEMDRTRHFSTLMPGMYVEISH